MKRDFIFPLLLAVMLGLTGCNSDTPEEPGEIDLSQWKPIKTEYTSVPLTLRSIEVVEDNNDFAIDLMKSVLVRGSKENPVLSPFSVFSTLAMCANADRGESRDEILLALGYDAENAQLDNLNEYCMSMSKWLPKVDGTSLVHIANSVWVDSRFRVRDAFAETVSEKFNAYVNNEFTLSSQAARTAINRWIESNTNGVFKSFYDNDLNSELAALLVNTLYFKGAWKNPFNPECSRNGEFVRNDGLTVEARYMSGSIPVCCFTDSEMTALSLPYGNGNFQMTLLLPADNRQVFEFVKDLSYAKIKECRRDANRRSVYAYFPTFKVSCKIDLNDALVASGISSIFDGGLDNIADDFIVPVSRFIHSVNVEVDEYGTEAGAVTVVEVDGAVGPEFELVKFNRPFMYIIEETSTGTILFEGLVTDPSVK